MKFKAKRITNGFWKEVDFEDMTDVLENQIVFGNFCFERSTLRRSTEILDSNGILIYEGDLVKVNWVVDIGGEESEFNEVGVVAYKSDNETAAWFVELKTPVHIVVNECSYDCKYHPIIQVPKGEYWDIEFEVLVTDDNKVYEHVVKGVNEIVSECGENKARAKAYIENITKKIQEIASALED